VSVARVPSNSPEVRENRFSAAVDTSSEVCPEGSEVAGGLSGADAGRGLRLRVTRASEAAIAVGVVPASCESLGSDLLFSVCHGSGGCGWDFRGLRSDKALRSGPLSRGLGFPDFSQVGLERSEEIWSLRPSGTGPPTPAPTTICSDLERSRIPRSRTAKPRFGGSNPPGASFS